MEGMLTGDVANPSGHQTEGSACEAIVSACLSENEAEMFREVSIKVKWR